MKGEQYVYTIWERHMPHIDQILFFFSFKRMYFFLLCIITVYIWAFRFFFFLHHRCHGLDKKKIVVYLVLFFFFVYVLHQAPTIFFNISNSHFQIRHTFLVVLKYHIITQHLCKIERCKHKSKDSSLRKWLIILFISSFFLLVFPAFFFFLLFK